MTPTMIIFGENEDKNNWIDLRDLFIEKLEDCDSELKLSRFVMGIVLSVCSTPEQLIELRKTMNIKTSKEEEEKLKKLYKDTEEKE